jgi:hypothetical protein
MDYQERYYYLRDRDTNKPRVTVCLIQSGPLTARGVAVCSPKDQFVKSVGRTKARGRAIRALKKLQTDYFSQALRHESIFAFLDCNHPILPFKSDYNPDLTDFERRILRMEQVAA